MESDLTIPSISTRLRISWNCRVSLGWQWCKGSSLQFKCSICQCFTIEIEKTSPNLTTARQGGEFHWFEWRRRGDIPIRNQIPLTSHDPSSSPALPVLHLFDHTDHTNHDQMAATYKENQQPRNDLANQCLQLIIRHRLHKRKHPNNPINEINSSNPPTGITPNGRLGIARRIGPNRCPKNFEPDAGFIPMTSQRTTIYLCLYNVFFTSCTYISHICEYTSYFS